MTHQVDGFNAYKKSRETASDIQKLIMLYDGAILDIKEAREALQNKKLDVKFNLLNNAAAIINGLREILDFEKGGHVAKVLDDYYRNIDARILRLQCYDEEDIYESIIRDLKIMKTAWEDVEKQLKEQNHTTNSDVNLTINETDNAVAEMANKTLNAPIEFNVSV